MTVLPLVQDHLAAVVSLLEADGIAVTTEDDWPDSAGWQGTPGQSTFVGFCRVKDISGAGPTGEIDGVRSDRRFLFHIQSVGATEGQANKLRDRVQPLITGGGLTIPGRALLQPAYLEQPGQTDPSTDVQPTIFVGWDQYAVPTTPA